MKRIEEPLAPTSALPLKLDLPGIHEGMYLPLPQLAPVPDSSLPNVVFVHMRQFCRMHQRRLAKADGDFHFSVVMKKRRQTVGAQSPRQADACGIAHANRSAWMLPAAACPACALPCLLLPWH